MQLIIKNIQSIILSIKNFIHIQKLMAIGTDLTSPMTVEIMGNLTVRKNVRIENNVTFKGNVILEDNVLIESNCSIKDSIIRKGSHIRNSSILSGCDIGSNCRIGPFARVRPQSFIKSNSQIGNYVEIKNSIILSNTKINHLTYIGDADIGKDVIIGAGCVTCNYDGLRTQKTIIEDNAFIGSGVFLVAPLKVGESATIGSGSVITQDVPANKLTLARSRQTTSDNWKRPKK